MAIRSIPTLRMLTMGIDEIATRATQLNDSLKKIGDPRMKLSYAALSSKAGGGALPLLELPSKCLTVQIRQLSANALARNMRENSPPIIGRIENDAFIIDPRTLQDGDLPIICSAIDNILKRV